MANAELIKNARIIADSIHIHSSFQDWEAAEKDTLEKCADALEAADEKIADCVAAIDALDDSNDAYIKENERLKKRIAELEVQMKKGEEE